MTDDRTNYEQTEETFIAIPPEQLSKEALDSLIEEYILREGTDYGHDEVTLEQKKERIYKQLQTKRIQILFSSSTQNTTLVRV